LVNLGVVREVGLLPARFSFTNRGDEKVHISDLSTSCSCLVPRLDKRDYEPGESGEFSVFIDTPNQDPGHKEYFITLQYEDPVPREVELTYKVLLAELPVTVRPKALMYYLSDAPVRPREVVVTDTREEPLKVTGVESSSPFVTATLVDVAAADAVLGETRVSVSVDPQTPHDTNALLTLTTNDLRFPRLHVPIMTRRMGETPPRSATGDSHSHQHR
jgi:hypothetical protein